MVRAILACVLLVVSAGPLGAQHQQPYCDNFAYPWQGRLPDGTFGLNSSVVVPPGPDGVYPIDIYFPGPESPQPTRFSLISWAHKFPDAPSESLHIRGYVEIWPRKSGTAAHESILVHPESNQQGDVRWVTKNMSMPLTPGMHYTTGIWNSTPHPLTVELVITVQVCFATAQELAQFRVKQYHEAQGARR